MSELDSKIKAQLINGLTVDEIMGDFDVSRSRVIRIQSALDRDLAKGEIIDEVMEKENVQNNLQILSLRTQQAAIATVEKARSMVPGVENASELYTVAEIITKVHTAFFVTNVPQVAIQNNYDGANDGQNRKYSSFLSDTPRTDDN